MKTFKTLEEIQPYYNANTNTYEFVENGNWMDVKFEFNLNVNSNIKAYDINAFNIKAWDINAFNIKAWDIKAYDINARDINAYDINYYAVCFAYSSFKCHSVQGRRENSRHFCLDREIEYKEDKQ